jgi:hypothetical protein
MLENQREVTSGEREIDDFGDYRNEDRSTVF